MRKYFFIWSIYLLHSCLLFGQVQAPNSAHIIINNASREAKLSDKNVMIVFGATWCRYCSKLDSLLREPTIHKIFNEHYIIVKINVREKEEKKSPMKIRVLMKDWPNTAEKNPGFLFLLF